MTAAREEIQIPKCVVWICLGCPKMRQPRLRVMYEGSLPRNQMHWSPGTVFGNTTEDELMMRENRGRDWGVNRAESKECLSVLHVSTKKDPISLGRTTFLRAHQVSCRRTSRASGNSPKRRQGDLTMTWSHLPLWVRALIVQLVDEKSLQASCNSSNDGVWRFDKDVQVKTSSH